MIGFDLDGTILTNDKRITEGTRKTLEEIAASGVIPVPVTGRPLTGIPADLLNLPCIRYVIYSNGSTTIDLHEKKQLRTHHISTAAGLEIMDILFQTAEKKLEQLPVIEYFLNGTGYHEPDAEEMLRARYYHTPVWAYLTASRVTVPDLHRFVADQEAGIEDISVVCRTMEERETMLSGLIDYPGIRITRPAPGDFEIGGDFGDKGMALLDLAGMLGVEREEVMAIGDGDNDLGLLTSAGIAVAMENSAPHILEIADFVTHDNEHDGAAYAMRKYTGHL